MKAPLMLEELLKELATPGLRDKVKQLYFLTYKEAYSEGKGNQRNECKCNNTEED